MKGQVCHFAAESSYIGLGGRMDKDLTLSTEQLNLRMDILL